MTRILSRITYIFVCLIVAVSLMCFAGCKSGSETAKTDSHGHAEGDGHDHSAHSENDGLDHSSHFEGDGHDHGSDTKGSGESAAVDWCVEHRVPESICVQCNPALASVYKAKNDWCAGHERPESQCYLCNPGIKFPEEALYNAMRQKLNEETSEAPKTSLFRKNSPRCATDEAVVQLASAETVARAGLNIETVVESPSSAAIEAPAEVEFDQASSYAITSLISGTLVRWLVEPGEHVREGQVLAFLESLDAATLQADFSHANAMLKVATASYERSKSLAERGMSSARDLQQSEADLRRAEADFRKAAATLRALGFNDEDLEQLNADAIEVRIPIKARESGTLVERSANLGSAVAAGESVGQIANTSALWVEAQVRERDFAKVKTGMHVTISSDGDALGRCSGHVTWVADAVDQDTRMGRVRIQAESNGTKLRAHQFVRVLIHNDDVHSVTLVPRDAVQWEGCCNIVFVREAEDRFRPRKVAVKFTDGTLYAVSGLKSGESVVTKGSYLLKTELMKGSLGAGCCGHGA